MIYQNLRRHATKKLRIMNFFLWLVNLSLYTIK
ncbi:hypothetical protein D3P96_04620 [Weissella viridescens]|uniref:Uncharacterized protein n=1 Tax=Weissella viridescens TaxID=1629 RepID=A0A3P2RH16_WEIVI|nr:hypothetical protein D3P96_04620 [Weissella viridescens]